MVRHPFVMSLLMFFFASVIWATAAGAAAVGRFAVVEGRVNLLKSGNLPAIAVKVGDPVESNDVIRTKSLSRAKITFIDDSSLTISPESRIAIEEYTFDAAQNKRSAVLNIFQGLALAIVNKIIKTEEPDFVVKTHTAVVGVRGTEFGMRLSPNSSTILNFKGTTQVGNIFPEVSRLSLKTFKTAFSFAWSNGSSRWVFLKDMQGTTVDRNMPPTKPFPITREDQMQFMRQLVTQTGSRNNFPQNLSETAAVSSIPSSIINPGTITTKGAPSTLNVLATVTVPPMVTPTNQVVIPTNQVAPTASNPAVSPPSKPVSEAVIYPMSPIYDMAPVPAPAPPTDLKIVP